MTSKIKIKEDAQKTISVNGGERTQKVYERSKKSNFSRVLPIEN